MNIGDLRHRITFQKLSSGVNDYGEPVSSWDDVKTVWSSVNPIVGIEYFAAETVQSEITHKIRIRYTTGITTDMRIKFNEDRYFSIISIINYQERNVEFQLMCKEVV